MTSRYDAVIYTLTGTCRTYNKGYCFPTQEHITRLVKKFHTVSLSRRHLNRILKRIEEDGLIERVRRHSHKKDGSLWLRSTLYKILGKVREQAIRKLHWVCGILGVSAVPKVAQHYSFRERKITQEMPTEISTLWKSTIKGRASPSKDALLGLKA